MWKCQWWKGEIRGSDPFCLNQFRVTFRVERSGWDVPFKQCFGWNVPLFLKWGGRGLSREGLADSGDEILESGEGVPAPFRWSDKAQGPTVRYQKLRDVSALSASRRGSALRHPTLFGADFPSKTANTFSTHIMPMRTRVSVVAEPRWGSSTTWESSRKPGWSSGSFS